MGLTGTYDEIMDAIMHQPGSSPQIATRALKWMAVSRRPLKPDELIAAAELDPATAIDTTALAPEETLDIDLLIQFCGGLLMHDKGGDVIRFSHLSVQEYLETESMNKYWDIIDAHLLVIEACLWVLQCARPESVPLDSYAACHWFHHCRFYQDLVVQTTASSKLSRHTLDVPSLRSFLASFDQPTVSYEKWRSRVSFSNMSPGLKYEEKEHLRSLPVYPAFAAAFGGLGELVSWLWLAEGADMNATDIDGTPILQYAIVSGSAELVERIIAMGADIHFANSPKGTALTLAAKFGHSQIVTLLLDRGVGVNAVGVHTSEETALSAAVQSEHWEVVLLLLERGADINVVGGHYGSALGCATGSGNVKLVSLLLDRGADINVVSGHHGSALGCAVWRHSVELVLLLLDRGADINVAAGHYGSALGCATIRGNVELVSLLLDRGADINVVGGDFGSALGCATGSGNVKLVSLLLDRGAGINVVGGKYGTALGCACACAPSHIAYSIVTLLSQRGADVNTRFGGQYGTALGVSASLGHTNLTRLLIDHGANPALTNDDGMNARALAEHKGHLDIVQLLDSLDSGSEPSFKAPPPAGLALQR